MSTKQDTTKTAGEEPEIYRNERGNPVIFANRTQATRKAQWLGAGWSVHQSPASRRFYVRYKAHAEALAEALRDIRDAAAFPHKVNGKLEHRIWSVANAALANWEAGNEL